MKISLIQNEIKIGATNRNFETIKQSIHDAVDTENPDTLVLTEMWNTGFFPENVADLADEDGKETQALLSQLAKENKVNIVGGSVAIKRDKALYNRSYTFNREGNLIGQYDKVHLFSPAKEDDVFESGSHMTTFELDGIKCGLITCYDIRFPEWVRKYALEGVQILFCPAAWPAKRSDHWDILARARAIENQFYVVATNHIDQDYKGHSTIIDPWGNYIVEPNEEIGIFTGDIDLSNIKEIRETINIFNDRQDDLY